MLCSTCHNCIPLICVDDETPGYGRTKTYLLLLTGKDWPPLPNRIKNPQAERSKNSTTPQYKYPLTWDSAINKFIIVYIELCKGKHFQQYHPKIPVHRLKPVNSRKAV